MGRSINECPLDSAWGVHWGLRDRRPAILDSTGDEFQVALAACPPVQATPERPTSGNNKPMQPARDCSNDASDDENRLLVTATTLADKPPVPPNRKPQCAPACFYRVISPLDMFCKNDYSHRSELAFAWNCVKVPRSRN